jgi:hypothetical protein
MATTVCLSGKLLLTLVSIVILVIRVLLYSLDTDRVENTILIYVAQLLPWENMCLRNRYPVNAAVYLLIPRSLSIMRSICNNISGPVKTSVLRPEVRGSRSLRNSCVYLPSYRCHIPEEHNLVEVP